MTTTETPPSDTPSPEMAVDKRWVRVVRVASLSSCLLYFIMGSIYGEAGLGTLLVLLVLASPWAGIYLSLRTGPRKTGLAAAMIIGGWLGFLGFLLLFLDALEGDFLWKAGLFALIQIALAWGGYKAYRQVSTKHPVRVIGMSVAAMAAILVIIGFFAFLAPRSRQAAANEASAIFSMRNTATAQSTYLATTGEGSYAPDLATLSAENLIDSILGSGTKDGYMFTVSGEDSTFTVTAAPQVSDETGQRSFFSDETGVIRWTVDDRLATANDTPL